MGHHDFGFGDESSLTLRSCSRITAHALRDGVGRPTRRATELRGRRVFCEPGPGSPVAVHQVGVDGTDGSFEVDGSATRVRFRGRRRCAAHRATGKRRTGSDALVQRATRVTLTRRPSANHHASNQSAIADDSARLVRGRVTAVRCNADGAPRRRIPRGGSECARRSAATSPIPRPRRSASYSVIVFPPIAASGPSNRASSSAAGAASAGRIVRGRALPPGEYWVAATDPVEGNEVSATGSSPRHSSSCRSAPGA